MELGVGCPDQVQQHEHRCTPPPIHESDAAIVVCNEESVQVGTNRSKRVCPERPTWRRGGVRRRWNQCGSNSRTPPRHQRKLAGAPLLAQAQCERHAAEIKQGHQGEKGSERLVVVGHERWSSSDRAMSRSIAQGAAESVAATKLRGGCHSQTPQSVSACGRARERTGKRIYGEVFGVVVCGQDHALRRITVPRGDDVTECLLACV
jgi:hypothetical protein